MRYDAEDSAGNKAVQVLRVVTVIGESISPESMPGGEPELVSIVNESPSVLIEELSVVDSATTTVSQ